MAKKKSIKKKVAKKKVVAKKAIKKKTQIDNSASVGKQEGTETVDLIDEYEVMCGNIPLEIKIYTKDTEYVPIYDMFIPSVGESTKLILERIRKELVKSVNLGYVSNFDDTNQKKDIEHKFTGAITTLVDKYFPTASPEDRDFFVSYLLLRSIGLGEVEMLMSDNGLEEIAINGANQPIWVYHRQRGWLKTNIELDSESQIKYFATTMGRKVGRQISMLEPLLDVTLQVGDRVNATLQPISNDGNTITIRKFAAKPWTITDLIRVGTISYDAAALIWQAIHYELSLLIAGGTASGKTSMLNVMGNFFPPNQRLISIEDTREIQLPKFLHWIPMLTRLKNTEGRGEVTMLNLLQNSLRMRPDRMLVGEIRKPAEAEVLFEAIHTGHSVYATVHANTAAEAVDRLTNPPISIPKTMVSALSLVVVQFRNRRSGKRRTFQIAEILPDGKVNVLKQYNASKDHLIDEKASKTVIQTIQTFSGISKKDIEKEMKDKENVLRYMVKENISTVEEVGKIVADYYTNPKALLKKIS